MMIPLLLLTSPASPSAATPAAQKDPPVQVSFNDDGKFVYGDRARVYVRPAEDGYLVVLRSDDRGNVRVLSPVDPDEDQQTHGGKKYEVKDRGGREAFVVEDTAGQGTVLAAWSKTPFDLRRTSGTVTGTCRPSPTPAAVRPRPAIPRRGWSASWTRCGRTTAAYEYDASTYVVYSPSYARAVYGYPYPYAWNGGWWGYDPWWGRPFFGTRVVIAPRPFGFRRFR